MGFGTTDQYPTKTLRVFSQSRLARESAYARRVEWAASPGIVAASAHRISRETKC